MALDYGTARVGVAVSDELAMMALPLEAIRAKPLDSFFLRLKEIIAEKEIGLIVVGMPCRWKLGMNVSRRLPRTGCLLMQESKPKTGRIRLIPLLHKIFYNLIWMLKLSRNFKKNSLLERGILGFIVYSVNPYIHT